MIEMEEGAIAMDWRGKTKVADGRFEDGIQSFQVQQIAEMIFAGDSLQISSPCVAVMMRDACESA